MEREESGADHLCRTGLLYILYIKRRPFRRPCAIPDRRKKRAVSCLMHEALSAGAIELIFIHTPRTGEKEPFELRGLSGADCAGNKRDDELVPGAHPARWISGHAPRPQIKWRRVPRKQSEASTFSLCLPPFLRPGRRRRRLIALYCYDFKPNRIKRNERPEAGRARPAGIAATAGIVKKKQTKKTARREMKRFNGVAIHQKASDYEKKRENRTQAQQASPSSRQRQAPRRRFASSRQPASAFFCTHCETSTV